MMRIGLTSQMTAITRMNSTNINYGKLENLKESEEIDRKDKE